MIKELDILNESRFELLKNHFREKNLFNKEWLKGEYLTSSQKFVDYCKEQIIKNVKDWDGKIIFSRFNISVEIDEDLWGIDAKIKLKGKRQLLITLSIDLILWIELLSINNTPTNRMKKAGVQYEFENLPANPLTSIYSNFFKGLIIDYEIKSLNQNEQSSIYYFFTKDSDYNYWGYTSYYSLLWIIYHEFAHFLCGHSGFYLEQIGENEYSEFDEKMVQVLPEFDEVKQLLKWSSEISADTYATFRLAFHVSQEYENGTIKLSDDRSSKTNEVIDILLNSPITALSVLDLLNLEEVEDYYIENAFYPPLKIRIFNLYIALKFIWFPSFHQNWDARRNLLSELYNKNFPIDEYQLYHKLIFRNLAFQDENAMRKGLFLPVNNYYDLAAFIGTIYGWRYGYTIPDEYLLQSNFRQIILTYCSTMRSLCVSLNLKFSKHLKTEWFPNINYYENEHHLDSKFIESFASSMTDLTFDICKDLLIKQMNARGLINDPVYKVFDDWMSNICEVHYKKPFDVIFDTYCYAKAYKVIKILSL